MKRSLLAIVVALSFACLIPAAKAQVGIYGQLNTTHESTVHGWYKGFTAGGYGNIFGAGPVHVGLDFRGTFQSGDQYHYRSFLVGPRLQFKPPVLPIRPYVEAAVGVGGNRYTGGSRLPTHYTNKLQYGIIGGLDYTLLPHIDLRVPEIGYIRMTGIDSGASAPAVNLVTVGFGAVVRLP